MLIIYLIKPSQKLSDQEKLDNCIQKILQRALKSTLSTRSADVWNKIIYFFIDFRWLEFQNWQATENDHSWKTYLTLRNSGQILTQLFTLSEKKRLTQGCVKFEQVLPQIGDFFVDCKQFWLFVNEHYLYVQGIILYHCYVAVKIKKEFVQKERNSLTVLSLKSCVFTSELHHLYC